MAEQEIKIFLKWENNNFFKLETKKNEDPKVTDIRIEENAKIEVIWSAIQSACLSRVNQILSDIGEEMRV